MTYDEKVNRVRKLADILLNTHGEPPLEIAVNYEPLWPYKASKFGRVLVQLGSDGYSVLMLDPFGLAYHYNHALNQHALTTGDEEVIDAAISELQKALVLDQLAGLVMEDPPPIYPPHPHTIDLA